MLIAASEFTVQASCSAVWSAITRFEEYPRWNPFVTISGDPELDAVVRYSFQSVPGKTNRWTVDARIFELDEGRRFSMRVGLGWILWFNEIYIIDEMANGAKVRHEIEFCRTMSLISFPFVKRSLARTMFVEDRGLASYLSRTRPIKVRNQPARRGFRTKR